MSRWVKLRTTVAGPTMVAHAGEIVFLDDDFARELVDSGSGEYGDAPRRAAADSGPAARERKDAAPVENAMAGPTEAAVAPRQRRRR